MRCEDAATVSVGKPQAILINLSHSRYDSAAEHHKLDFLVINCKAIGAVSKLQVVLDLRKIAVVDGKMKFAECNLWKKSTPAWVFTFLSLDLSKVACCYFL